MASRDKNDMKLVTVLQTERDVNSGLTDLKELNLPPAWEQEIRKIIYDNRMRYEPKMQTATSYHDLREKLKSQGHTGVPNSATPLLNFSAYQAAPVANTTSCNVKRTMLRKASR